MASKNFADAFVEYAKEHMRDAARKYAIRDAACARPSAQHAETNATPTVENGALVLRRYNENCAWAIPVEHAAKIKRRMEEGMPYWQASPLYWIDRDAAAMILNTPWGLLNANLNTRR